MKYCLEYTRVDNYGYQIEHAGIFCSNEQALNDAVRSFYGKEDYCLRVIEIK